MIGPMLLGGAAAVVFVSVVVAVAGPADRVQPATNAPGTAPDATALLGRFIERSQRFRRNGAIVGIVLLVAAQVVRDAIAAHPSEDAIDLVVLATVGLAGSIGGSIVAEAFRLRRLRGPRVASLTPRDASQYGDPAADRREQVVVVLAALGIVGAVVSGNGLRPALLVAAVVLVLAVLRRWAIRGIAFRPRPALTPDLAAADERVRHLAASAGISRPLITLAALLVSRQWFAVLPDAPSANGAVEAVDVVGQIGGTLLFLAACVWWWSNRSFGLTTEEFASGVGPRSNIGNVIAVLLLVFIASAAFVALARGS